jgi:uncharacterized repeat protein (TIGR04052 family)
MFKPRQKEQELTQRTRGIRTAAVALVTCCSLSACGDDEVVTPEELEAFALQFAAVHGGQEVGCGDRLAGFGSSQTAEAEVSDLRFFVSNVQFFDAEGDPVELELDQNEFQYQSPEGDVVLIDLTDTSVGACAGDGLSFPEGTARVNSVLTGRTYLSQVSKITFDVGVPQSVQKAVIQNHTAEDAPSPLRELHWSWGFAYRNFVLNFTILDGAVAGEGYLHVGSTDCGGDGTKALTDRQSCGKPNTASVLLDSFSLTGNSVGIDLGALLANLDFLVDQSGTMVPGVSCHSSVDQPDCPQIFGNLGIDIADGGDDTALNSVFFKR